MAKRSLTSKLKALDKKTRELDKEVEAYADSIISEVRDEIEEKTGFPTETDDAEITRRRNHKITILLKKYEIRPSQYYDKIVKEIPFTVTGKQQVLALTRVGKFMQEQRLIEEAETTGYWEYR